MHKADLVHSNAYLQNKLEEIYALRRTRSKVNWDRNNFLKLLEDFGNPHLSLPPIIHVAGTNGKGSVIAMLRSILEAEGYRVHVFTSPHLIDVNERIILAGEPIDNTMLVDLIDLALLYSDGAPLSFFEIITAIGFRAFADAPADVLLLEVGMGGRLDCTNVIEKSLATVINHVSMDHTEFLGDTIEEIAKEKAGIMKEHTPCLVGRQRPEVYQVLKEEASGVSADMVTDWFLDEDGIFTFQEQKLKLPVLPLKGKHQVGNAALAVATLKAVKDDLHVSDASIEIGLKNVSWRGRLESIDPKAFGLSAKSELFLDSGHNDSAGAAIADFLKDQDKPTYLVMGMLARKKIDDFLKPFLSDLEGIYITALEGDESFSAENVDGAIAAEHFTDALRDISAKNQDVCVLIAGSVYLVGSVLKTLRDSG